MSRRRATRIRAAQKKIVQAAAVAADTEAGTVAQKVYDSCLAAASAGRSPLWLFGPLVFLGEEAGARIATHHGLPPEEAPVVAAYLSQGLYDLVARVVTEFDRDHYEEWRRENVARLEERDGDSGDGPAAPLGAAEGEPDQARVGEPQAAGSGAGDDARGGDPS